MAETIKINKNFNNLTKSQNENLSLKDKELIPKINLFKSINSYNYYNNNFNNIKDIESNENKISSSPKKFKSYSDLNNKSLNINFKMMKENLSLTHPIKNLNINKSDIDISSQGIGKDFLLKSKSNKNFNNIKHFNKIKNESYNLKDDTIIDNKSQEKSDNNNNITSHNNIISDLLIKTEDFFNNLGLYLDGNSKKNFDKKKYNRIKINKKDFNSEIQYNKKNEIIKREKSNIILNDENNKINIINNNINNFKSINNYNLDGNHLNQKNILLKNKSFNINENKNDFKMNDNNSKIIKKNIKVYYKKNKYDKIVSDEIIQTFNISTLINKKGNKNFEHKQKKNNVLPIISPPLIEKNEYKQPDKNDVKIAELKPVYPVYPYNRIVNLNPLNENKYNYNIHRKILLDMKDDFRHDDRYNYEQLMKRIKFGSNNKYSNSSNRHMLKSNSSNEIIYNNWEKSTKFKKLII